MVKSFKINWLTANRHWKPIRYNVVLQSFKAVTRVRISLGTPTKSRGCSDAAPFIFSYRLVRAATNFEKNIILSMRYSTSKILIFRSSLDDEAV